MKKKTKADDMYISGPSVILYNDDIEEIVDVLKAACTKVTIEDDEYEYASLEELKQQRGKKIKKLTITGHSPYIILKVKRAKFASSLYAEGTEESIIPYTKIKAVLERRKRRVLHFFFNWYSYFVLSGIVTVLTYIISRIRPDLASTWISHVAQVIIIVVILAFVMSVGMGGFSLIVLNKQHEQESFWDRNKDVVIVGIIMAIIGSLLTLLVTYLTSNK